MLPISAFEAKVFLPVIYIQEKHRELTEIALGSSAVKTHYIALLVVMVHGIVGGLADGRQTDCASWRRQAIMVNGQSRSRAITVDPL